VFFAFRISIKSSAGGFTFVCDLVPLSYSFQYSLFCVVNVLTVICMERLFSVLAQSSQSPSPLAVKTCSWIKLCQPWAQCSVQSSICAMILRQRDLLSGRRVELPITTPFTAQTPWYLSFSVDLHHILSPSMSTS
jgi:hypothetical protein